MLRQVSWYTERPLTEISLGGLLILVVIRTIQYNMTKMRVRRTFCIVAIGDTKTNNLSSVVSNWTMHHLAFSLPDKKICV